MLKRKCPDCAKKIDRSFRYCPWCGTSIKSYKDSEDFGILGKNDHVDERKMQQEQNPFSAMGLPMGLDKMMGPLMKQLERELSNLEKENGQMPKNIKITFGAPGMALPTPTQKRTQQNIKLEKVSEEETKRRQGLEKKEAESKVKRLSDKIIYEIDTPGIKNRKDVSITQLAEGIEIKAYTEDTCYTKTIPLQIEISNYTVQEGKVIVEMKNE